jgi:CheY-like chemotaxis protein
MNANAKLEDTKVALRVFEVGPDGTTRRVRIVREGTARGADTTTPRVAYRWTAAARQVQRTARRDAADDGDADRVLYVGRVLVAEDDYEMRRVVAAALREAGYQVFEVSDGDELERFLRTGRVDKQPLAVDLIVSDIRMPGTSGLTALADLRSEDWATPVILITAFGSPQTYREARRLGAATLLDKPFELDELVHAVRSIVPPRLVV